MNRGFLQLTIRGGAMLLLAVMVLRSDAAQDPYFAPAEQEESYSYGKGRFTGPPIHALEEPLPQSVEKPTVIRDTPPPQTLPSATDTLMNAPSAVPTWSGLDDPHCPIFTGLVGYDAWRGYPDGGWSNFGMHAGLNYGTSLGDFSDQTGIGLQMGGTVGVYDWAGTDYRVQNQAQRTTQGFVTYGLFRNATSTSNWSFAFSQDWMINNNYSVMGEDMTMYQWRGLVGYALSDEIEVGCWGTFRGKGDTRNVNTVGQVGWQPHQQWNLFVHKKWQRSLADTWLWVGLPEQNRLVGAGSLGDYITGAYASIPISSSLAPYTMVNYMHPSASPGVNGSKEAAWNLSIGISFVPRELAQSRTVRGHRWAPKLPVANNGLFLVDTTQTR